MPRFEPLPQQAAIFDWARNKKGSAVIIAGAGCGKTTTLVEMCRMTPGRVFIGAFNNPVAKEIGSKIMAAGLGDRVDAGTWHSAGYRTWKNFKSGRVPMADKDKCASLLSLLCDESLEARKLVRRTGRKAPLQLVGFAKNHGFGVEGSLVPEYSNMDAWVKLCQDYGLDEDLKNGDAKDVAELALQVFQYSIDDIEDNIDFDDQLWAPLYFKAPFRQYDWVMLDEAQDTAPIRRLMALAMQRKGTGRFIAVGDPFQAINRFAGADSDALDLIKAATSAIELPLSVTMRCPKAVVAEVKRTNPQVPLEAHENAPEGSVSSIHYADRGNGLPYLSFEDLTTDDVILCRNTRPLVELFFRIIDEEDHIPVRIEGSSPAQAYVALIESLDSGTLTQLILDLDSYYKQQSTKWATRNPEKLDRINDKVETVRSMANRCLRRGQKSTQALVSMINQLFGSDWQEKQKTQEKRLTLSTIHKAKGKEWRTVYILGANMFMPSKYAKKPEDIQQEKNLMYVAQTRTKDKLIYITCAPSDFGEGVPLAEKPEPIAAPLLVLGDGSTQVTYDANVLALADTVNVMEPDDAE